jgi:hypothetical protein
MEAVKEAGQTIIFCGVKCSFPECGGRKEDQDLTRSNMTMLIHAQHRWPKAIDAHLWP